MLANVEQCCIGKLIKSFCRKIKYNFRQKIAFKLSLHGQNKTIQGIVNANLQYCKLMKENQTYSYNKSYRNLLDIYCFLIN